MSGRLVLVRHGEPVGHAGRCVGQYDTDLSPAATAPLRRIAESVPPALSAPRIVVSSDLRRAADSAALLARTWRAELRFDPRLRELSFGDWEGCSWHDIAETDRAALDAWGQDWTRLAAPGGETGLCLENRVRVALDGLRRLAMPPTSDIVVVSHAGWIRVAATLLLSESLTAAFDRTIDYAHAAIFDVGDARCTLTAWNVDSLAALSLTNASALRPALP